MFFEAHGSDRFDPDLIGISGGFQVKWHWGWQMLGFGHSCSNNCMSLGPGYYAITGCKTPNDASDRGCGPNGPNDPR